MKVILDEDGLAAILDSLGIQITGQTYSDIICFCPFHHNDDSPAFNIIKTPPFGYRCWNPVCGVTGNIYELVSKMLGISALETIRYILSFETKKSIEELIEGRLEDGRKESLIDNSILQKLKVNVSELKYLIDRGFTEATLEKFEVGYSAKRNRITIPVFDDSGRLMGITGRALSGSPKYQESRGLPKHKIFFNMEKAKNFDTIVVVEGPLDAMRVDQAGFPNVVATMGTSLGSTKIKWLSKFKEVIIFTDNDEEGRKIGRKVVNELKGKKISWAIYPENIKDPGEMTEAQIAAAINNRKNDLIQKLELLGIKNEE